MGDLHDPDTEDHAMRTRTIALQMGEKLHMDDMSLRMLGYAAEVHDFGKTFILKSVLQKNGRLNKGERAHMERHCELGAEALELLLLPQEIMDAILYHQEHWDGSGYPKKLSGEDIPMVARIVCIADIWDALLSDRPYRSARSAVKALEFMTQNASWFDPKLFTIFLSLVRGDQV
jgi:HD-GYP domain-containing protein (c-di-GMP phosphodiesterase class II)